MTARASTLADTRSASPWNSKPKLEENRVRVLTNRFKFKYLLTEGERDTNKKKLKKHTHKNNGSKLPRNSIKTHSHHDEKTAAAAAAAHAFVSRSARAF